MKPTDDELGAHVSTRGGVQNAPARARDIASACLQLFTKQPNRWAEPVVDAATVEAFKASRSEHAVRVAGAHDSYLINLSSPDRALWGRSLTCFSGELKRCTALELDFLVTHPGNATDGDVERGIRANARGITLALEEVGEGPTRVLLELTAGSGTTVGASFENLAAILEEIPASVRHRVGVCVDTCHAYAAGYDLAGDYEGVWRAYDAALGRERLGLLHLNDSKHPLGSRKDRHETLGEGTLGSGPFRSLMIDASLRHVPKILETPKGDDPEAADLANLAFLRAFRRG
ncbi:MAG: deoxyribonuclease IV [Gemmatimonadota bacterium]|jgi:deoxyribonuclease-4